MAEFTPCRHDGESMVSLMEQHGYSEDDMLLCKLCQKEEIKGLTDALEQAQLHIANLALANSEARKTIDRLNEMIPREANDAPWPAEEPE